MPDSHPTSGSAITWRQSTGGIRCVTVVRGQVEESVNGLCNTNVCGSLVSALLLTPMYRY